MYGLISQNTHNIHLLTSDLTLRRAHTVCAPCTVSYVITMDGSALVKTILRVLSETYCTRELANIPGMKVEKVTECVECDRIV